MKIVTHILILVRDWNVMGMVEMGEISVLLRSLALNSKNINKGCYLMGTNFYKLNGQHIGKRSAAGPYCWDCGITLSKGRVHYDDGWYEKCPKCGKTPKDEGWESAAGRELGFNKTKPKRKTGVASCSSFTWANKLGKIKFVKDEYDRKFTVKQFKMIFNECPIQFYHLMGENFS